MTTASLAIQLLGVSHLLQPPISAWLAKRFALREDFAALPPLARQIATNMGLASVVLPTSCGCLLAIFGDEVQRGGGMFALASGMGCFWLWRLYRQASLRRFLPPATHLLLCTIFALQGPGMLLILMCTRYAASP